MRNIIYTLIVIFFTACGTSNIPDDVKWKITKEEPNAAFGKDNVEIELNKKVDEKILKEIALEIRSDRQQYNKLWIFYKIEGVTSGMAWATTHFTPDLEVVINGSTENQDIANSKTDDLKGQILGKWRCDKSLMGGVLILYKDSVNNMIMRITFKDGGKMDSKVKQSDKNGKTQYNDDNKNGEYYILESNGNLGLYGNNGKFDEATKIE